MTVPAGSVLDPAVVPLLERLWAKGVKTYQSCSGHVGAEGHPSAVIWLERTTLDEPAAQALSTERGIEQVASSR